MEEIDDDDYFDDGLSTSTVSSSDSSAEDSEKGMEVHLVGVASLPTNDALCKDDSDVSDLEDGDHLKQLCKGFTDKIKEKMDTINMCKKIMFDNQLQLVKREALYQRKLRKLVLGNKIRAMRNQAEQGRVVEEWHGGTQGEYGKDALFILPEEIWTMILEYVTNEKDIRSCAKVCVLFQQILEATKTQWLFDKIFPFIFNNLRKKETLKCRFVCKRWRSGVDNFLEEYYTSNPDPKTGNDIEKLEKTLELPNVNFKPFHFEYTFSIPPPPDEEEDSSADEVLSQRSYSSSQMSMHRLHDGVRKKMKLHPKNPFIGRSVTMEEDSTDFDHVRGQVGNASFLLQSLQFLEDFGKHILHLTISCQLGIQKPLDIYKVCAASLTECKNLRTLCVNGLINWSSSRRSQQSNVTADWPQLVDNPHLESLQIDHSNPKILVIQDKLVEKFKSQLKQLEVQIWNVETYSSYQWPCLTELHICHGNADRNLLSLKGMQAPNLRQIFIRLDKKGPYLQTLLELTNHFPKLSHLDLKFESRFGGTSDQEVMNLPAGLISSPYLTSLELTSCVTDLTSYNFLMCFPFLERLIIRHGHWSRYNYEDAAAPYLASFQPLTSKKEDRRNELIKLAKYVMMDCAKAGNTKQVYKSNVWKALPFLQVLEIRNARFVPEKQKDYTRQGYDHFHQEEPGSSGAIVQ